MLAQNSRPGETEPLLPATAWTLGHRSLARQSGGWDDCCIFVLHLD